MRVLVVDNDRDTADMLVMLLRLKQCDVRVAYDARSGLEEATKFEPDLLLADLAMPHMSGNELARQVRQHRSLDRTILAALTGYADAKNRELATAAGFTEYLVKPLPVQTLCELLLRVSARVAASQAAIEESAHQADLANAIARRSIRLLWERETG